MIKIIKKEVLSSDNIHQLKGVVYVPDGEIKALFQVVHGMTDHISRYDEFMKTMAENGYLTFGYDHLGHGETAVDDSELGYFSKVDGWKIISKDVKVFADKIKEEYPNHPYYLLGHSMGSFIVRCSADLFGYPDKLLIMGSSGRNPIMELGLISAKMVKVMSGEKKYSPFLNKMAFGSYNKKTEKRTSVDWISKDKRVVDAYLQDKYCTFNFTNSAMLDLVRLNRHSNLISTYKRIPNNVPLLFMAGEDDPVGNYGKSLVKTCDMLKSYGKDVKLILYKKCRHEILNDTSRDKVISDILEFIK